ncbi:hypothetical protein GYA49_02390 [Candidatus Beckwithbacteria bacterium]|nr:hypothetical protein [Candidatus Beckwithbacteria bacterium]
MKQVTQKIIQAALTAGAVIFTTVSPILAQGNITIEEPTGGVKDFGKLLSAGIQTAIILAAILTFAFLIWGGIQWITSGGDKAAYEAARGRITAALVGLAIVAAAWAVMKLVGYFFGVNVFDFEIPTASGS